MLLFGTKGRTSEELAENLEVSSLNKKVHDNYQELITEALLYIPPTSSVSVLTRSEAMVDIARDYMASVHRINFFWRGGPAKTVNDLIAAKTDNMIQNVFFSGSIDVRTAMILESTFAFNGTWPKPFDVAKTLSQALNQIGGLTSQRSCSHSMKNFVGLNFTKGHLAIPKFMMENTILLNAHLTDVRIIDAFSPIAADFTGITQTGNFMYSMIVKLKV